ncbi:MAG: NAD(P)/FAD-dependent oxidoreductase, partial [Thiotrichales bacterium]|nr:NAD(P)/FAD-dependent oxidoreductase [Thiotrichales bacterium]
MQHIIIGAGPAGVIAAETIRRTDPAASVTIIGEEKESPYSRMALPYYLIDKIGEDGTFLRKTGSHYKDQGIDVLQERVASVDTGKKTVTLENNGEKSYDKLLIATGSTPISPPIEGIDLPAVHNCWTLEDGRNIAKKAKQGSNVVLMGAGFIGCIILEALAERGVNLTVVEMGDRMVPRMMNQVAGNLI